MIAVLLFIFTGFVFGYGIRGPLAWIFPLLLPLLFGIGTVLAKGFDDLNFLVLLLTLALTALGVLGGRLLQARLATRTGAESPS